MNWDICKIIGHNFDGPCVLGSNYIELGGLDYLYCTRCGKIVVVVLKKAREGVK